MGSVELKKGDLMKRTQTIPIPDREKNPAIQRLIESHMFREAKVIEVNLIAKTEYPRARVKKFAEVVYMLGEKIYRAELKLRDDRHWDTRRKDETTKEEGVKGSHLTASDLLGKERVSSTEEVNGRVQL